MSAVGKKLKATLLSERTQALLAFIAVTIGNAIFHLNLHVPSVDGSTSPLVLIAANVGAFIVGKSLRSSTVESTSPPTPHDPPAPPLR